MNYPKLKHVLYLTFLCLTLTGCKTLGYVDQDPENVPVVQESTEVVSPKMEAADYRGNPATQPRHIALLLPLTGKNADSAKAIREGYLASYYDAAGSDKGAVRVYDTNGKNIKAVYQTAVSEGADFVVGPLAKEEVIDLGQLSSNELRIPVLALNHHPALRQMPRHFVQFTLAPEAEAEQLAEKAYQKGYQRASIIVPNNVWGKRTANALANRWRGMGGTVLQTVYINASQDQSPAVRQLLGIDQSQKRANEIKQMLSEKVEFQPKRRQDMDVIFMAASPDQARQLKPLFDFYYAENVPVYATSSIYSGQPNPARDRDINGVTFGDMPWLIDANKGQQVRKLLSRNGGTQSDQYNRLFAMGVDAYHLSVNFDRLQNGNMNYPGATGNLSLGPNQLVQRRLVWAKMQNGIPTLIN